MIFLCFITFKLIIYASVLLKWGTNLICIIYINMLIRICWKACIAFLIRTITKFYCWISINPLWHYRYCCKILPDFGSQGHKTYFVHTNFLRPVIFNFNVFCGQLVIHAILIIKILMQKIKLASYGEHDTH